jgi:hypothetical protein
MELEGPIKGYDYGEYMNVPAAWLMPEMNCKTGDNFINGMQVASDQH